jgi:hypothetical protein
LSNAQLNGCAISSRRCPWPLVSRERPSRTGTAAHVSGSVLVARHCSARCATSYCCEAHNAAE